MQVREVSDALTWTLDSVRGYGGDPARVTLLGHSAGAQLCLLALLHRARATYATPPRAAAAGGAGSGGAARPAGLALPLPDDDGEQCTCDGRMPAAALLMAGVYDVPSHFEYEESRGVHMLSTMERALGGWAALRPRSPLHIVSHALHHSGGGGGAAEPPEERETIAAVRKRGAPPASSSAGGFGGAPPVKRARSAAVEPAEALLNPPDRVRAAAAHPLLGSVVAARACGRVAGASVPPPPPFCAKSDDAAERFAAAAGPRDISALPRVTVMSSIADETVPWYESVHLERVLGEAGADVDLLMYTGVLHKDFVTAWEGVAPGRPRGFQEDIIDLLKSAA